MSDFFEIPLSYNPIEITALAAKLNEYSDRHHTTLIHDFEKGLSKVTGVANVVGLNNGTSAIHLALKLLGVGPGDYVVVSTFTYVASVSPIHYFGAVPVLVDCEASSWNMDPLLTEKAVQECIQQGKKPKVILVVHTYGMPADMNSLLMIAKKYNIPVLEDAAEAIGSLYNGKALGSLGDIGVLSFNSNKMLTTYGGGAVLVKDLKQAELILFWATHSRKDMPYYEHEELGYNYRIGPINAAVGLVQLDFLNRIVEGRRNIFSAYLNQLSKVKGIGWQKEVENSFSNRWLSCFTLEKGLKEVREEFRRRRIETRPLWKPMHQQLLFKNSPTFLNGTADHFFATGICLPSSNDLPVQSISSIAEIISTTME